MKRGVSQGKRNYATKYSVNSEGRGSTYLSFLEHYTIFEENEMRIEIYYYTVLLNDSNYMYR